MRASSARRSSGRSFFESCITFTISTLPALLSSRGSSDSAAGVITELRRLGADDDCYVISNNVDLDGATKPLSEIIERVFAFVDGTLVCCVPGRLAYFEGEAPNNRFILHRRAA